MKSLAGGQSGLEVVNGERGSYVSTFNNKAFKNEISLGKESSK